MFYIRLISTANRPYLRSGGSETLNLYRAAASKVSNPLTPSLVQGGSFGPPQAASTGSSTSGSSTAGSSTSGSSTSGSSTSQSSTSSLSTTSAATTTPTKSASVKALETKGGAHWIPVVLAVLVAAGVGSLII